MLKQKPAVFKVPVKSYGVSTDGLVDTERYFEEEPMEPDVWQSQMLAAQRSGRRLCFSSEWSSAQRHYSGSEQEEKLVYIRALTGTVLDYEHEELLEGIELRDDMPLDEMRENPLGAVKSVATRLGMRDGIVLPHSNVYVRDLPNKYMKFVAYLHGVKDPKRDLHEGAYIFVERQEASPSFPIGGTEEPVLQNPCTLFRPVRRGSCSITGNLESIPKDKRAILLTRLHEGDRLRVYAQPSPEKYFAWQVSDTPPEGTIVIEKPLSLA